MNILHESSGYISILEVNANWLKESILQYAEINKLEGNTCLNESWSRSVNKLTEALALTIKISGLDVIELNLLIDTKNNPLTDFSRQEVQKYRQEGITLILFLDLLRYSRQSYLALFDEKLNINSLNGDYFRFTEICFNRIESDSITFWNTPQDSNERIMEHDLNAGTIDSTSKYQTVFESLFAPIIILDDSNQIINYNPAASHFFINSKNGISLYDQHLPKSFKWIAERLVVFNSSSVQEEIFETEIESSIGERYYKVLLKKVLDVNSRFKGTILMIQDLTDQHKIEENLSVAKTKAEEADQLKTSFLANMSHEIRTPMNAIVGFTELLLNENHSKTDQTDFLKLIRKSSKDLLNIIEDIIDIAKLESKQLKIKYKASKVYEIFTDLHVVYKETLRRYGVQDDIELILTVDAQLKDLVIYSDGERLKQVLSNLLNNAVKFTNRGFIEFGYKIIDGSSLFFFVRDSGTGVPDDMKKRIFERFVQLEKHTSMNLGGAGLGLAICKSIVQMLGGEMWLESSEDRGSDFYFQIPLREVPKKQIHAILPDKKQISPDELNLKNKTILIAEDDDINYMLLSEMLTRTGAELIRAKNGLDAINLAESVEKIDLILMDIKMPHVDGLEASKYINSIRPNIPIIAQTAFALEGDKTKCLNAGCSAYITKPVDKHKLFLLLEQYIFSDSSFDKTYLGRK